MRMTTTQKPRQTRITRTMDVMKKSRLQRLRDGFINSLDEEFGREATREKLRKVSCKVDQKGRNDIRQKEQQMKRLHELGQKMLESLRPMPVSITV
ncbi:MAG: hypothetical protein Q7S22_09095 [Candidatus Micrarchaeota archaeon]|nr:hypothetical protein [Candidatus Micrarchaeota archaeon]